MTHHSLPDIFLRRLEDIIPAPFYHDVVARFSSPSPLCARVNTLKISLDHAHQLLADTGITYQPATDIPEACVIHPDSEDSLRNSLYMADGKFYYQSLSSMLAVVTLDPAPQETILDLCAAPGSKTSQIAARMNNSGLITAVEAVRGRFYKLKSVLDTLGVENTRCLCMDGRRFENRGQVFDRVLVDAPCSSEGRFRLYNSETFCYWSLRKIKEMVKKQRGLLLHAGRQLRPGGVLVYATCTFAPEENEGVVDWFLTKASGQFMIERVEFQDVETHPAVMSWGKKVFNDQVRRCVRVLPDGAYDGFFMTKFRKQA